jgi:hypothetical protein
MSDANDEADVPEIPREVEAVFAQWEPDAPRWPVARSPQQTWESAKELMGWVQEEGETAREMERRYAAENEGKS